MLGSSVVDDGCHILSIFAGRVGYVKQSRWSVANRAMRAGAGCVALLSSTAKVVAI